MYKSRVTYDKWKCMLSKQRRGSFVNRDGFKGYVGLLTIKDVSSKQIWKHNDNEIVVCDKGYHWLTILPKDESYCITVMMDDNYHIQVCYIDLIADQGIDDDNVPFFIDAYLDLIVYPDGEVLTDDQDELDQAFLQHQITKEQYERVMSSALKLRNGLIADYESFLRFIDDRFRDIR